MRFNAVLFDLDGTIADSAPGILQSMQLALQKFGIDAEPQQLRRYLGPPLADMFADFLPAEQVADGVAAYRAHYLAGELYHATLYPGVRELIIGLYEEGCRLCLATAKPQTTAKLILQHFGLAEYFTIIGGTDEEHGIRTKTQVIQSILDQLQLSATEVVMFGDRKDDLLGAAACGIAAVGAGYGYAPAGELEALSPYAIVQNPQELLALAEGDFVDLKNFANATAPSAAQTNTKKSATGNPLANYCESVAVRLHHFDQLTKKQKQRLIAELTLPIVVLIVLLAVLIGAFTSGKKAEDNSGYSNSAYSHDLQEYAGVILPETEDAGQSYIDETVFAGDSNTVRLCNFGEIDLQNTLGYVGIGIGGVTEKECIWFEEYENPVTMVKAVSMLQPRRIIMMFGTNNTSMDTTSFIEEYDKAYTAMQQAYPYADIIIAAVPPIGANRENAALTMKKIDSFNLALVQLAKEKGCMFLNGTKVLRGADGYLKSEYAESDGLHLTAKGAAAYLEYVRTHSYITDDDRPAIKNVPTRMQAPYMPSESEVETAPEATATPQPTLTPTPDSSSEAQATPTPVVTPAPPAATPTPTPIPETTLPPATSDVPTQGTPETTPTVQPPAAEGAQTPQT